ncbi:PEGA domain-containing protein [Pontiella sp.]|uniref:PEGA domain-containing protein n=1 Tax=Pontiella sp. TaxID=2837462 RepID=UPI0035680FE4
MIRKAAFGFCIVAGIFSSLFLSGCAPVTMKSTPSGAEVYYKDSNELIGTTPLKVNLLASDKELLFRKPGYFSKTIVVSPIDPENISVVLARRDRVLLVSKPNGAELFVEGVGRVGRTPYRIDYSKPYREFLVRAPGYAEQKFTIPEDPEGDVMVDLSREDTVMVESNPKNADVYVANGKKLGTTPLAIPATEKRYLQLRKEGYYELDFSISEHTPSPYTLKMEREPIVIVESEPSGATVVHRGVTLGVTPFRQLLKGDMEIEVMQDRYYTKQLTIAPDSPRLVTVKLKPKPYVIIKSNPSQAVLYRSGGVELIGTTPIEVLVERDSAFEIHKEGYDIKPFMLSSESSPEVVVPLIKSVAALEKVVLIDSKPSGAKVYRPGGAEFIGTTPLKQHVRSERSFELQLEGFETKIVTVAPDSADTVVFALAEDESARNIMVSDPLLNTPSSF